MANYHAIYATSEAICDVLRQSRDSDLFDADITEIGCRVFSTSDFSSVVPEGEIALFPYRVNIDSVQRTLPAFHQDNGIKKRHHLPLELHFLLIPRAKDVQKQLSIMGWMMRVIEDNASLPAALLNIRMEDKVFSDDEHIEVTPTQLTTEEILRLWDQLPSDFNISVPYCARLLRIESPIPTDEGPPVLQRDLDFRG